MIKLTKKYIFEQKLKGKSIKLWPGDYDDSLYSWLNDITLLHECKILIMISQKYYKIQYDIEVIYFANSRRRYAFTHRLKRGTTLSIL